MPSGNFRLAELHKLLEASGRVVDQLASDRRATVDVSDYYELCSIILEVLGWTNTAYTDNPFGISPTVLNKFVKMRGAVKVHTARAVADRVRTYLRSQDQKTGMSAPSKSPARRPQTHDARQEVQPVMAFKATTWVAVSRTPDVQAKISAIAAMLDSIIEQVTRSNLPPEQHAITAIEKQQLIAILETALNMLRSPLMERGLLKKVGDVLSKGAQGAVEKSVQTGLGKLMAVTLERLNELAKLIF